MENGVERLAALMLLLTCFAHCPPARLANAAIHLPLGLLIVAFHNLWTWPEAVVTVIGWALLLKGTLHLLFPQLAQRTLRLTGDAKQAERRYRLAGLLMLPLALAISWIALR